jgi:GAF domain-containing protein
VKEMSSETDHLQIVQAVARSGQPAPALECLCALFRQAVGFDLFTVTLMKQPTDAGGSIVSGYRMYSTIPDAFPAVVEVPFGSKEWTHAMVVEKQILVMDTVEDYRRYYEGWASLKKAGYRSAANLPVVFNGAALGTINLTSKKEAYFTAERLNAAGQIQALSALVMLACSQSQRPMAGI